MTVAELVKKGAIYFDNIAEGFQLYQEFTIEMDEVQAAVRFRRLMEKNGPENSFVDFYYFRIDQDARNHIRSILREDEVLYLETLRPADPEEDIIFPLTAELIDIIVKLNAKEMLFSTVYFTKERSTWWGNYEKKYAVFIDRAVEEDELVYQNQTEKVYIN